MILLVVMSPMGKYGRFACTTALALVLSVGAWIGHEGEAAGQAARARSWLGVELGRAGGPGRGVAIRHVVRGSPAYVGGLRDGDVIVRLDEVSVARPDDVIHEVTLRPPGRAVRLVALRGVSELTIEVTLARFPALDEMLRLDKVGAPAPSWGGIAPVAGPVPATSRDVRGKVVVLDFWATWCVACRLTAPRLSAWQAKFGAQGLAVIGITDDSVADATRAVASFGMRYAVGSDESYATQLAFGVTALPTVFLIDKRGVVRDVSVGFDPQRELEMEGLVQRLLAEPGP